jgi:uncharacterized protein YidB (DUF937 family)
MSMFDDLAKGAVGALGGALGDGDGSKTGMAGVMALVLSPEHGGLDGLVKKFEQAGMGDVIKSWISTGPNPAINGDQLHSALGPDLVAKLAGAAGIKPEDLMKQLSAHLPGVIDKLTPNGAAPSGDSLQKGLTDVLGGLLGGKL